MRAKPETYAQTVLADRPNLKGQKLSENATFWIIFKHCVTEFHCSV